MKTFEEIIAEMSPERKAEIRSRTNNIPKSLASPRVIMLVGCPASGKSTWRSQYEPVRETVVISTDDMIDDIAAREGISYSEAFAKIDMQELVGKAHKIMQAALTSGKDVIIDRTNMSINVRARMMSNVPKKYLRFAVVFEVEESVLKERLERRLAETGKYVPFEVVQEFLANYETPTLDEFDIIQHFAPES